MLTRTLLTRLILIVLVFAIVLLALLAAGTRATISVPVLNVAVKAGDVITDKEIGFVSLPAGGIGPSIQTSKDQLVGKTVAVSIPAGEPIKADELGTPAGGSANSAINLDPHFPYANAADLLKQKLPVFPALNQTSGGLIQPGDYVTLFFEPGDNTNPVFLLQKVHVIAARSSSGRDVAANVQGGAAGGGLLTTPTNGASGSLIAVYIVAACPDQAILIAKYDPHRVYYLYTTLTDPDITGVPSGQTTCTNQTTLSTPAPSASGSPSPSSTPAPVATQAPVVTPASSGSPTTGP
jgi:hypothetical protein